jgi:hypothetical protein
MKGRLESLWRPWCVTISDNHKQLHTQNDRLYNALQRMMHHQWLFYHIFCNSTLYSLFGMLWQQFAILFLHTQGCLFNSNASSGCNKQAWPLKTGFCHHGKWIAFSCANIFTDSSCRICAGWQFSCCQGAVMLHCQVGAVMGE